MYMIRKEINSLKWVEFDNNFKPAGYDKGFKQHGVLCIPGEFPQP